MIPKNLFPVCLIILDVCASIVYIKYGDYRRAGYWISAALISYFALTM